MGSANKIIIKPRGNAINAIDFIILLTTLFILSLSLFISERISMATERNVLEIARKGIS